MANFRFSQLTRLKQPREIQINPSTSGLIIPKHEKRLDGFGNDGDDGVEFQCCLRLLFASSSSFEARSEQWTLGATSVVRLE